MANIRSFPLAALAASLAFAAAAPAARADESAAAVSLFDEGNRLYEAGNFAEACPKYEASLRLDASSIDTRGRLALCYEKTGRLASAWTAWREVKSRASRSLGREHAVEIAASHIADLDPHVARLTLRAAGGAPAGLSVTMDGAAFPTESLDVAVAVDKGNHRIEASAPGKKPWSTEVAINDGERKNVDIGPFVDAPAPPRPPEPPASAGTPSSGAFAASPPRPLHREQPSSARKWIGITALGVGVVGLGLAGLEGADAMTKRDDAKMAGCQDNLTGCPSQAALSTAQSAYDAANLATIFGVAGGVLTLTGIILWATAPSALPAEQTAWHVTPSLGSGQAGVVLSGAF